MRETRKEPLGEFQSFGSFPSQLSYQLTDGHKEWKDEWAKLLERINQIGKGSSDLDYLEKKEHAKQEVSIMDSYIPQMSSGSRLDPVFTGLNSRKLNSDVGEDRFQTAVVAGQGFQESSQYNVEEVKEKGHVQLWEGRHSMDEEFMDCYDFQLFLRNIWPIESWLDKQEDLLMQDEELCNTLDSIESLLYKYNDFIKSIPSQEVGFEVINKVATKFIRNNPSASDEIAHHCDLLRERRKSLNERTTIRHKELCFLLFEQECEETTDWLNEGVHILDIDLGSDLTMLQQMQHKYQRMEQDLAALWKRVQWIQMKADRLMQVHPKKTNQILECQKEVNEIWNSFVTKSWSLRSLVCQSFLSNYRDLIFWIESMTARVSSEKRASNTIEAEALVERHQQHRREIDAHAPMLQAFKQLGQELMQRKHRASQEVSEKLESLEKLEKIWAFRKTQLDQRLDSLASTDRFNSIFASLLKAMEDAESLESNVNQTKADTDVRHLLGTGHPKESYISSSKPLSDEETSASVRHLLSAAHLPSTQNDSSAVQRVLGAPKSTDDDGLGIRLMLGSEISNVQQVLSLPEYIDNDSPGIRIKLGSEISSVNYDYPKSEEKWYPSQNEKIYPRSVQGPETTFIKKCIKHKEVQNVHQFLQEADKVETLFVETLQVSKDESYNDPIIPQAEQQSCIAELAVNTDCPQQVISNSQFLIVKEQCRDTDDAVTVGIDPLVEQLVYLTTDINERKDNSQEDNEQAVCNIKIQEDNEQAVYNIKINDIEIQQGEADTNLTAKYGHDLPSVLNKQKNHQCSDVIVKAHDDPVKDLNDQVDQFCEEKHSSSDPYDKMFRLGTQPQVCFDKANAQQEFFRATADAEDWIDGKRLLVDSDDGNGEVSSMQNCYKRHKHLDVELRSHRTSIQSPKDIGVKIMSASRIGTEEIDAPLQKLLESSEELKQIKATHWLKLKKAPVCKQFSTSPDKEEMWIMLMQHLPFAGDYRDTLAVTPGQAAQYKVLQIKCQVHPDACDERHHVLLTNCLVNHVDCNKIPRKGNHDVYNTLRCCTSPQRNMERRPEVANCCRANLADNSLQQLIWSIGILESGMVDEEIHVDSEFYWRAAIQTITQVISSRYEQIIPFGHTWRAAIQTIIQIISSRYEQIIPFGHTWRTPILNCYCTVSPRWLKLLADPESIEQSRLRLQEQHHQVRDLHSIVAHDQFKIFLSSEQADSYQFQARKKQVKNFDVGPDSPSCFTMNALKKTCIHLQAFKVLDGELVGEQEREEDKYVCRKGFVQAVKASHCWLARIRSTMMKGAGSFENAVMLCYELRVLH